MIKRIISTLLLYTVFSGYAQQSDQTLSLERYLTVVKKNHPLLKQAQLISKKGSAKLQKARGGLDPKIELDYDLKNFKKSTYYDKLNTVLKIPTAYGISFKASYEVNDGKYLNPEYTTPNRGLYSAGVSISLARNLLINERAATLRRAKLYQQQSLEDQRLQVNELLFKAVAVYFDWLQYYQIKKTYKTYIANANFRLRNVKKSFEAGDKPAIDTLEASINLKNRKIDFEKAKLDYLKASLKVANFVWSSEEVPMELREGTIPSTVSSETLDALLNQSLNEATTSFINKHPKIKALNLKRESALINKKLKANNLLPIIDLEYNFLSADIHRFSSFNTANYKGGIRFSIPLFMRKQRGDLKLAKLKLEELDFDIQNTTRTLKNKISVTEQKIASYTEQNRLLTELVDDYRKLVASEERKFNLGEGSLFLVNYREVKLIEQQLKAIKTQNKLYTSKSELVKTLANFSL